MFRFSCACTHTHQKSTLHFFRNAPLFEEGPQHRLSSPLRLQYSRLLPLQTITRTVNRVPKFPLLPQLPEVTVGLQVTRCCFVILPRSPASHHTSISEELVVALAMVGPRARWSDLALRGCIADDSHFSFSSSSVCSILGLCYF